MLFLSRAAADAAAYLRATCPDCITARDARASVLHDHFFERLATLLLPLLAMSILAALFSWLERAQGPAKLDARAPSAPSTPPGPRAATPPQLEVTP